MNRVSAVQARTNPHSPACPCCRIAITPRLWSRKLSTSKGSAPLWAPLGGALGENPGLFPPPPRASPLWSRRRSPETPPRPHFPLRKEAATATGPREPPFAGARPGPPHGRPAPPRTAPRPPCAASPAARDANGSNRPLGSARPLPPSHGLPARGGRRRHLLAGGRCPRRGAVAAAGRAGAAPPPQRSRRRWGGGRAAPRPPNSAERRLPRMLSAGRCERRYGRCSSGLPVLCPLRMGSLAQFLVQTL